MFKMLSVYCSDDAKGWEGFPTFRYLSESTKEEDSDASALSSDRLFLGLFAWLVLTRSYVDVFYPFHAFKVLLCLIRKQILLFSHFLNHLPPNL